MQSSIYSSLPHLQALIGTELTQVSRQITQQLSAHEHSVNDLLEYLNARTGKMIRPALLLLSAKSCGRIKPVHIRLGAIVEILHTATLLHDDVLDDARKRNSRPTVNNLYGNETAVLLGDLLLSKVFALCAKLPNPRLNKILAAAAANICKGELRQNIEKNNPNLGETEYIDIISAKTASFFSACCSLGAISARASRRNLKALEKFGLNLGIAFQIADDLLDIIGDETKTGKTPGRDFERNKLTLPVIHFLHTAPPAEKTALIENWRSPQVNLPRIRKLLLRAGSLDYAHTLARQFYQKAIRLLIPLKNSPAKQALLQIAQFIVERLD